MQTILRPALRCLKYVRALLISTLVLAGSSAPAAMAYVEFLIASPLQWQSTIEREFGFEAQGFYMNPSVSFLYFFPELNLDLDNPLTAPLTIEFGDPDGTIFDDGANAYFPQVVNGSGSLTYDLDWSIKEWDLTVDIILSESWYGTFTSAGQMDQLGNAHLVMNYDGFQPRPYIEPYDISEFYTGPTEGFLLLDHGLTVPEPQTLPLLLSGLSLLLWSRRHGKRSAGREKICVKSVN